MFNRGRHQLQDHEQESALHANRTKIAMVVVAILLSVLLAQLYVLQVVRHDSYQTRSNGNRIKVLPVAPNRGIIYDRNGEILAENTPVFSLQITKSLVNELDSSIQSLQQLLKLDEPTINQIERRLKNRSKYQPVDVIRQLTPEQVALFSANQHKFPGITIEATLSRFYPHGDSLTHVLGYVARINKRDKAKLEENDQLNTYAATKFIGKQGIERYHESLLHGEIGYEQVEVNNQGKVIRILDFDPPVPGNDLVLHLDMRIQRKAQQLLAGRRGSIIVTEPTTGGVLAMVSNPSYDPNLFVHGISSSAYNELLDPIQTPLLNRATQGLYPPASTIKPLLALVALEQQIVDGDYTITDRGQFTLAGVDHVWRDWKRDGHGDVDLVKSIEVSCDTYFYQLAHKMGIDTISENMQRFGFGEYTGLDLFEESKGNMPTRGWKKARYDEPWYLGDTISVGIGQGYWNATPIQLINSLNMILNKGRRIQPQILRGTLLEGETQIIPSPELAPVNFNQDHLHLIMDAFYGTVNRDHGTAYQAFRDTSYTSGGKTGTAQLFSIGQDEEYDEDAIQETLRDNAMYVGFAPIDDPQISIVVTLENAGGGSSQAAPVAQELFDLYFSEIAPINMLSKQGGIAP